MVLNENLGAEMKAAIEASGRSTYSICKELHTQTATLFRIYTKKDLVHGMWVDALDKAGYDIEIVIKKK